MSTGAAILRGNGDEELGTPEPSKTTPSTPLNEREINNIYADIRAIRQTQDTHFRTLTNYILAAFFTTITVVSGFGIAILSKLQ